jgi:D-alanyl-D-alanine endopeptidase (penicillin-binding protein 7)
MGVSVRHCSTVFALGLVLCLGSLFVSESAVAASGTKKKVAVESKVRQTVRPVVRKVAVKTRVPAPSTKALIAAKQAQRSSVVPEKLSYGKLYGLHSTPDQLALKSSVALVVDQDTHEVLFSKNSRAVLPIASLTKLMTALVVTEAKLPMDQIITVTQEDVDTEKGSRSRLRVGTQLSREEMLHLALMSSENRAANALGRTYPGGLSSFVKLMNRKAQELGMRDTAYVEPTGLSSLNQSSANDLAVLVNAAYQHPIIRELSTSHAHEVDVGKQQLQFRNTNLLVRKSNWDIGLQKTGYIAEAGRCLVMQSRLAGRKLIMVFLDSNGKYSRIADAERVRKWIEDSPRLGGPSSVSTSARVAGPY